MKQRTTQEKKKLSYERDRRNNYDESPHAAREAIPLRKALRNRANRHYQNQQLKRLNESVPGQDVADSVESLMRHRATKDWKKYPDAPLGEVILRKLWKREVMQAQGGRRALLTIRYPKQED